VTAANTALSGCRSPGHCIDAAVFSAAGPELFEACKKLGGCETGDAKITHGYRLPASYIIHTVGPVWDNRATYDVKAHKIKQLTECYTNTLDLVKEQSLYSVAFCCIGTGVFGVPQELACRVAVASVQMWLKHNRTYPIRIVFDTFTEAEHQLYRKYIPLYFADSFRSRQ
jgi:O-acetyl-ADP-ribose deacetylase (regulator of RNase III)